MNAFKTKKSIPMNLALVIIFLMAVAAGIVIYLQYDQKQKLIAANAQETASKESYVMSVFDRIESNLAKIREKESMIRQDLITPENNENQNPEERIQNEIQYIQSLIDENNNMIASLNKQIDEKDSRLKNYEGKVKDLQARITKYAQDMENLVAEKEALKFNLDETTRAKNQLSAKVDTLNNEITVKSNEITDQKLIVISKESDLNRAYYTVGTYKELRDKNIVQKEGGVLGVNRVKTLTENPNEELFTEIDIRDITKIPVFSKHWEIVTGQDPSSYELTYDNKEMEWLQITDPEKFWKKSKYLVIVTRDNGELAESR